MLPWWTLPARLLDRVRPGLAEQAAQDAAWLERFPAAVRTALAAGVVAIPLIWAAVRSFDTVGQTQVTFTMRIQDVYLESIPFMVIAGAIGMAAPTLGILFLAAHVMGDLAAAFVQPKELSPLPTAVLGRFVSFWILYLLVAELPMAVHEIAAWARTRLGGARGALGSIAAGAGAATLLALAWAGGAPLLIRPVFTWSDLKFPTGNAGWPLLDAPHVFAILVGAATLVAFVARYQLWPAIQRPSSVDQASRRSGLGSLVFGVAVPIVLFSSVVTQPIDAVVLVAAVLAARPLSAVILRGTGLAVPLSIIPRPIRLILGIAVSAIIGTAIVTVLGYSTLSNFFSMNVVMGVSFIIVRTMLDAEDFVPRTTTAPSLATGIVISTFAGLGVWLFTAGVAFADNIAGQNDGWQAAAAAGGAAAGAGGLAAASAGRKGGGAGGGKKPPPNPPPWYIPDAAGPFFGYDGPPPPPPPAKPKGPPPPKPPPPGQDY